MNTSYIKSAQNLIAQNSAMILTGTGILGVFTTAALSAKAALKAEKVMEEAVIAAQDLANANPEKDLFFPETPADFDALVKLKLLAPIYAPAIASGITACAAILFSYRISVSKSAALAAAYAISERNFSEYKAKVLEHVTGRKAEDIDTAVRKQRLDDDPAPNQATFYLPEGEQLCYDFFSKQYFKSSMEKLRKAQNDTNIEISRSFKGTASLNGFYEKVGAPQPEMADSFVWSTRNPCELSIDPEMAPDGSERVVLVVQFSNPPLPKHLDDEDGIG